MHRRRKQAVQPRWSRGAIVILSSLLAAAPAGAQKVQTFPDPIRLTPEASSATLTVTGLPGRGPARAAVNVGVVDEISQTSQAVSLRYRLPVERFPQELCFIAWRWVAGDPRYRLFRVPLLGRTEIPIKAWPNAELVVSVGAREFGPYTTGKSGRRSVTLLVEPAAREAKVRVTGDGRLTQEKRVPIVPAAYNPITLAVLPLEEGQQELKLLLAVAGAPGRPPWLEVSGDRIQLEPDEQGLWVGRYRFSGERPTSVVARTALRGQRIGPPITLPVEGPPSAEPPADDAVITSRGVVLPPPRKAAAPRVARGLLGVGVGMLHNLGSFISPSFTLEAGVDIRLPYGSLTLAAVAGLSWSSQDIRGNAPLAGARSQLFIVPLGGQIGYRLPLRHVSPYLAAGVLAQLVRVRTTAPFLAPDEQRVETALAVFGVAGAEAALGPGALFLQGGYRWSRLDVPDLVLLAGGIVLDLGYRFYL